MLANSSTTLPILNKVITGNDTSESKSEIVQKGQNRISYGILAFNESAEDPMIKKRVDFI